jgi:hypothetical protein
MSLCVLVQRTTHKTTEVRGTLKTDKNKNGDDTTSVGVGGRLFVPIPDAACTLRYCTTGFHAYEDASCVPSTLDDLEHACPTVIASAPSPYDTLLCWGDVLLVPFSVDPMQTIDSGMPMWIAACEATRVARSQALHTKDVVMLAGHADAVARRRKRIVRLQGQGGQKQGGEPNHVHGKRTRGRVRAKARGTSKKTRRKAIKRGSDDDEETVPEADTETEAEDDDEEDDATTASSQNDLDEEDGDDATSAAEGSLGNDEEDDDDEDEAEEAEAGDTGEAEDVVAGAQLDAVDDAEEDEASATENEETDADTDGDTDADTATDGDNDEDADD